MAPPLIQVKFLKIRVLNEGRVSKIPVFSPYPTPSSLELSDVG